MINCNNMKSTSIRFFGILVILLGLSFLSPIVSPAQEGQSTDTTSTVGQSDESSAFQDSVRFDDMDPIFYEAEEDEPLMKQKSKGMSMTTIAIILVVVLGIIIILVKKFTGKKD